MLLASDPSRLEPVLHGSARTTPSIRYAIQTSAGSAREIAAHYGVNLKTVLKWRKRETTADLPMGPKERPPSAIDEVAVISFRRHALLPLDDCLYGLLGTNPTLTRSSLHRIFQRHGVSRLPTAPDDPWLERRLKDNPLGCLRLSITKTRTQEGIAHIFVAMDRTSKYIYSEIREKATKNIASQFLVSAVRAVPFVTHTVITDNSSIFVDVARKNENMTSSHIFEERCRCLHIRHIFNAPDFPWTKEQVESMDRIAQDTLGRAYGHPSKNQLVEKMCAFVSDFNSGRRLKSLAGLTPNEYVKSFFRERNMSAIEP